MKFTLPIAPVPPRMSNRSGTYVSKKYKNSRTSIQVLVFTFVAVEVCAADGVEAFAFSIKLNDFVNIETAEQWGAVRTILAGNTETEMSNWKFPRTLQCVLYRYLGP